MGFETFPYSQSLWSLLPCKTTAFNYKRRYSRLTFKWAYPCWPLSNFRLHIFFRRTTVYQVAEAAQSEQQRMRILLLAEKLCVQQKVSEQATVNECPNNENQLENWDRLNKVLVKSSCLQRLFHGEQLLLLFNQQINVQLTSSYGNSILVKNSVKKVK